MRKISDNSALIQDAFEGFAPSAELVERVKEKRFGRRKKSHIIKRAVVIPVAACLAVLFTVTAAAELFGFDEILGRYIRIDDSELAQSLIGTVSDVRYTVSDDDYKIEVMGVTGSYDSMFAAVKLSRKDGAPVIEHFLNECPDDHNISWQRAQWDIKAYNGGFGGGGGSYIDEYGDIVYTMDINGDDLTGKKIEITCDRLVLHRESFELENENDVYYGLNHRKWGYYKQETNEPVDFDDSSVLCLPIGWSVSFKYTASENALAVRYADISKQDNSECTITEIKATASGVQISITCNQNIMQKEYVNKAYMIMNDNTHIPLSASSGSSSFDGEYWYISIDYEYSEEVNTTIKQYIDITEAKAVYFDGVTYELE